MAILEPAPQSTQNKGLLLCIKYKICHHTRLYFVLSRVFYPLIALKAAMKLLNVRFQKRQMAVQFHLCV